MEIKQKLSLDFGRDTHPITVFAKQNDTKTRFLEITPLNCGQAYALEDGITPRLQLTKADGHTVFNDATIENGVIVVELTQQALAAAGVAVAEIGLYNGEALLSSQIFYIDVERAAFDKDAPASSDEFNALVNALGKVDVSVEAAGTAAAAANTAASNAAKATTKADTATTNANNAALAANAAAQKAGNVNIKAVQTATGATVTVTDKDGVETAVHIDTLAAVNTWEDIKNAVRLGLGAKLFPVGYEFTTEDSVTGAVITWVVRGHDHHVAANDKLEHTMTLEAKYVYSSAGGIYKSFVFDATEALYFAAEELPPGTYHFTWNYDTVNMVSGTYQFTLTQAVPAGGQIKLGTNSNSTAITRCKIATYGTVGGTDAIESGIVVSEGSEGTSLGTINASSADSENLNCAQRIMWGSNNYAQSAVRQWLNSKATAGSVWTPTNIFDRRPSWATSYSGFMLGLPSDFLAAIQLAVIPCRTNSVYEVNSLDGTEYTVNQVYELQDKFFLLSRPEIYGVWDSSSCQDGEMLKFYERLTDTERKKYDATGTARRCWVRSPFPGNAGIERNTYDTGVMYSHDFAYLSNAVAPACIIA